MSNNEKVLNILFLDLEPQACAFAHNDKDIKLKLHVHTRIMIHAHLKLDPEGDFTKSLKPPVVHFPSSLRWITSSRANYQWLHDLWFWLNKEYFYRYELMHDDWPKYYNKLSHKPKNIPDGELTVPPNPELITNLEDDMQNAIESFRLWYTKKCKAKNATWGAGSEYENFIQQPNWMEYANV